MKKNGREKERKKAREKERKKARKQAKKERKIPTYSAGVIYDGNYSLN